MDVFLCLLITLLSAHSNTILSRKSVSSTGRTIPMPFGSLSKSGVVKAVPSGYCFKLGFTLSLGRYSTGKVSMRIQNHPAVPGRIPMRLRTKIYCHDDNVQETLQRRGYITLILPSPPNFAIDTTPLFFHTLLGAAIDGLVSTR